MAPREGRADPLIRLSEARIEESWRQDNLEFSFLFGRTSATDPRGGRSELSWRNVGSLLSTVDLDFAARGRSRIHLRGGFGPFLTGRVTDKDWFHDGTLFSHTASDADAGGVGVFSLLLDRPVGDAAKGLRIYGGYDFEYLGLHLLEKGTTDFVPGGRDFRGLDSTYDAQRHSLVAGLRGRRRLGESGLTLTAGLGGGIGYSYAEANWNLRSDFRHPVSFTHEGIPLSGTAKLGIEMPLGDAASFTFRGEAGATSVLSPTQTQYQAGQPPVEGDLEREFLWHWSLGLGWTHFF